MACFQQLSFGMHNRWLMRSSAILREPQKWNLCFIRQIRLNWRVWRTWKHCKVKRKTSQSWSDKIWALKQKWHYILFSFNFLTINYWSIKHLIIHHNWRFSLMIIVLRINIANNWLKKRIISAINRKAINNQNKVKKSLIH